MTRPDPHAEHGWTTEYEIHDGGEGLQESPVALARRLLRGRVRLAFTIGATLGVGLAIAGYLTPTPQYRSYGVVEVVSQQPKILYKIEEKDTRPMFDAFVDTNVSYVRDPRVISEVMRSDAWQGAGRGLSLEEIRRFEESLVAERINRTPLIEVAFVDEDPAVAQKSVNAVIQAFLERAKEREQSSEKTRIAALDKERVDVLRKLQDLREQEKLRSDGLGADWYGKEYERKMRELTDLSRRIMEKQVEIDGITSSLPVLADGTTERAITIESLAAESLRAAQLVRDRSSAETALDVYENEMGLGGRDPRVLTTRARLEAVEAEIATLVEDARKLAASQPAKRTAGQIELDRKRAELAAMIQQRDRDEEDLRPVAKMWTSLQDILKEQQQAESQLDLVHERLRQLEVEFGDLSDLEASSKWLGQVRPMHEAEWPGAPYRDRRVPYAVAGAFGGLALGFLIVALYGFLRGDMRHVEDVVGDDSRERFLAIVPEVRHGDAQHTTLEMTEYCVHHLRTLLQIGDAGGRRSIALTSPSPGAGKSTIGMALALSFGATGSRTLVVDCDLVGRGLSSSVRGVVTQAVRAALDAEAGLDLADPRSTDGAPETQVRRAFVARARRVSDDEIESLLVDARDRVAAGGAWTRAAFRALETMARYEGVNGFAPGRRMGVIDVLAGAGLEECVLDTGFANVAVLPIGEARPSDAERLSPAHVKRLIQLCHQQYDTVIFDTGPVLGSLEASFVAAVADEVVFVVARGESRRQADEALKRLDRLGARVAGITFNRADVHDVVRTSYRSSYRSTPEDVAEEVV